MNVIQGINEIWTNLQRGPGFLWERLHITMLTECRTAVK